MDCVENSKTDSPESLKTKPLESLNTEASMDLKMESLENAKTETESLANLKTESVENLQLATIENCCLCKQLYREPRILPCLHTFCLDCLQKFFDESTEEQSVFQCPKCFEPVTFPVQDLPRHIYADNEGRTQRRLAEMKASDDCENCKRGEKACAFCRNCGNAVGLQICKHCADYHQEFVSYRKHAVVSLDSDFRQAIREGYEKESYRCPKHNDQVLKYFCTSCESLVCNECIVSGHRSHKYDPVEVIFEQQKTELRSKCSVLEKVHSHLSRAENESKEAMTAVDTHLLNARKEIEKAFSAITEAVEKTKTNLLVEAESLARAKKSKLQMQKELLTRLNMAVRLALDITQHSTQSYSPVELISMKPVLMQAFVNLEDQFSKTPLAPLASPAMAASVSNADVITAISSLGSVEEKLPCSPSHSGLIGIDTKFPVGIPMDAKCTLILQTRNRMGEPLLESGKVRVKAWLADKSGRKVCDGVVMSLNGGRYAITFVAEEECPGKGHFMANGEHVNGSPCDVLVRDYAQVRTPVLSFRTKSSPTYLYACRGSDDIFVTLDDGNVCLYSKDGVLKSTIDGDKLGLKYPRGITVDEENDVMYIASAENSKIVKATIAGKLISSVGGEGSGPLQFKWPNGLCQDTERNIYVADCRNKRVQVLASDLTFIRELKCDKHVIGVAVDTSGGVHVATSSGVAMFPGMTKYGSRVSCGDVVIGPGNYKFVSCRYDACLEIYRADNTLLGTVHGLQWALGVCLEQSGHIYVADYYGKEVYKF